jgi:cyclohexyl-isocyanide hydratase
MTEIGFLLYPNMTPLDLLGPYEVLSRLSDSRTHLAWKTLEPVTSERGLALLPSTTFGHCPTLDVLCVPGGPGQVAMMDDEDVMQFLERQGATAKYITSVCTGALLLGGAGLLRGYRATTHWMWHDELALLGAEPVRGERIVVDRNRITGGGVTAGIDFGLTLAGILRGREEAEAIQLWIEYNPRPPFDTGSPDRAPVQVVERLRERSRSFAAERREATLRAAKRRHP